MTDRSLKRGLSACFLLMPALFGCSHGETEVDYLNKQSASVVSFKEAHATGDCGLSDSIPVSTIQSLEDITESGKLFEMLYVDVVSYGDFIDTAGLDAVYDWLSSFSSNKFVYFLVNDTGLSFMKGSKFEGWADKVPAQFGVFLNCERPEEINYIDSEINGTGFEAAVFLFATKVKRIMSDE
jgi:hypothetical protein